MVNHVSEVFSTIFGSEMVIFRRLYNFIIFTFSDISWKNSSRQYLKESTSLWWLKTMGEHADIYWQMAKFIIEICIIYIVSIGNLIF